MSRCLFRILRRCVARAHADDAGHDDELYLIPQVITVNAEARR